MNGAQIPNWAKLAGMGLMLGLQGAGVWYAQAKKVDEVVIKQDVQLEVSKMQTQQIQELKEESQKTNDYLEDTVTQANVQHRQMWLAIGKPGRAVDMESRKQWERKQWEWQK